MVKRRRSKWDEAYRKDKHFRLYTIDYDGDRYTVYGDDLYNVTSELTLRWLHIRGDEIDYRERQFCELAEYIKREGLMRD